MSKIFVESKCRYCGKIKQVHSFNPFIEIKNGLVVHTCEECVKNCGDHEESKESEFHHINKAKHYNSHPSGIECKEIIRHYNCAISSAIKYLWRHGLKDGNPPIDDLRKAIFWIQDEIERLEGLEKK